MSRWSFVLLLVLALLAVLFVPRALGWRSDAERWKADRDRWRMQNDSTLALVARESELRTEAERREAAALDSLEAERAIAARADASYRAALEAARTEPAPPECVPVIVAYEAVIARADSAIAALKVVADREREARLLALPVLASLRRENAALRALVDSATVVIDTAPVHASPFGLGATCGLGLRGWDCVGGLTVKLEFDPLGWLWRIL